MAHSDNQLTAEELAEVRRRCGEIHTWAMAFGADNTSAANLLGYSERLLATVEALRAENERLRRIESRIAKLRRCPDSPTSIHLVLDALEDPQ